MMSNKRKNPISTHVAGLRAGSCRIGRMVQTYALVAIILVPMVLCTTAMAGMISISFEKTGFVDSGGILTGSFTANDTGDDLLIDPGDISAFSVSSSGFSDSLLNFTYSLGGFGNVTFTTDGPSPFLDLNAATLAFEPPLSGNDSILFTQSFSSSDEKGVRFAPSGIGIFFHSTGSNAGSFANGPAIITGGLPVPEPSTITLLVIGLGALGFGYRRRKKTS